MAQREKTDTTPARIIGQDAALTVLAAALKQGIPASSYLFFGPSAVGKYSTALAFLQAVLCDDRSGLISCQTCASCRAFLRGTHPDAILFSDDRKNFGIDDVRSLQQKLMYRPTLTTYRVALIDHAELLTIEAANALLKILEEPPQNTILLLCTMLPGALPLTVRSRCQHVEFHLVDRPNIYDLLLTRTERSQDAIDLSHVAMGRPGLAITFLEHPTEYIAYRERVEQLMQFLLSPIGARLRMLQELIPPKMPLQELRESLLPMLDLWTWILRDAALLHTQNESFIVHRFLSDHLLRLKAETTPASILLAIRQLDETKKLIRANVNPQLALEYWAIAQ